MFVESQFSLTQRFIKENYQDKLYKIVQMLVQIGTDILCQLTFEDTPTKETIYFFAQVHYIRGEKKTLFIFVFRYTLFYIISVNICHMALVKMFDLIIHYIFTFTSTVRIKNERKSFVCAIVSFWELALQVPFVCCDTF